MRIYSTEKTIIKDLDATLFELSSFDYNINDEYLKGTEITITENSNLPSHERNKFYFDSGFFDLKNKNFTTGKAKIHLKKNLFDRSENDPRIYGVSSILEEFTIKILLSILSLIHNPFLLITARYFPSSV